MHLAKHRNLKIGGTTITRTPIALPSYSSVALADEGLAEAIARTLEIVVGPVLISAYDLHKGYFEEARMSHGADVTRFPLTFIDSGGYEKFKCPEARWSERLHRGVLSRWPRNNQAIIVSYDTPSDDLGDQIDAALSLLPRRTIGRELLLKLPENSTVGMAEFVLGLRSRSEGLSKLDVIGLTEKEAGDTLRDRLRSITALRRVLDDLQLGTPIHVFGGLDPCLTYLYFLAGADIFDGLTWLRNGYDRGRAVYLQELALLRHPNLPLKEAQWEVRKRNFTDLPLMQISMQRFLVTGNPRDLHPSGEDLVPMFYQLATD